MIIAVLGVFICWKPGYVPGMSQSLTLMGLIGRSSKRVRVKRPFLGLPPSPLRVFEIHGDGEDGSFASVFHIAASGSRPCKERSHTVRFYTFKSFRCHEADGRRSRIPICLSVPRVGRSRIDPSHALHTAHSVTWDP